MVLPSTTHCIDAFGFEFPVSQSKFKVSPTLAVFFPVIVTFWGATTKISKMHYNVAFIFITYFSENFVLMMKLYLFLLTLNWKDNLRCHRWQIHFVFGLASKFCLIVRWRCQESKRVSAFSSICVIRHVNFSPSITIFFVPEYLGQRISTVRYAR